MSLIPVARLRRDHHRTNFLTHPTLHRPEITLLASRIACPAISRIIKLIENGTINTDPWITHHIDFDEVVSRSERL